MSAHMRKLPTKNQNNGSLWYMLYRGEIYAIPKNIAKKYKVDEMEKSKDNKDLIHADEVFENLDKTYSKAGALLKGLRYREGLNQAEFGKIIGVSQTDISKMENGKRPIGRTIAKRIGKIFELNYRIFLE